MSSIPEEICLDIILRLPVKSVLACKCVCKTWYSMISNPDFVKSHLSRSIQNNNYSLMIEGYGEGEPSLANTIICGISYDDILSNDIVENAVEFDYPFKSSGYDVVLMCSCDGLVSLWIGRRCFCLWNPCTKEYKVIPDSPNQDLEEELSVFAFGYDSKIDDYKFFKVLQPEDECALVDVYTLGSNSWRSITDIPYNFLSEQSSGVFLNQAFHWFGSKMDTQVEEFPPGIISLDISNERFEEMQLPEEPLENRQSLRCMGVLKVCLCVLVSGAYQVDVWVMKDYGVQESWSKHFNLTHDMIWDCLFFSFIWSFENDKVLLYAGDELVLCDPRHMNVRNPWIRILRSLGQVENHVESLVSLNSGTYVRRESANCK